MRRRDFLRAGAAGVAAMSLPACTNSGSLPPGGADAAASEGADAAPGSADGAPGDCAETEANPEGPFYTEGAPSRSSLVTPETEGTRLTVSGRVLSAASCEPIAGAMLDFWQANAQGDYDNQGFELRGVLATDEEGRFELLTIVPGNYLNGDAYRPAHIHVKIGAAGHGLLTTQLYFPDDPYNEQDALIADSLIMAVEDLPDGSRRATYDFAI